MTLPWGSGPLADAARRLAPDAPRPAATPVTAADRLAAVLDLPGSVLLAERLADWEFTPVPEAHPEAADRVRTAGERLDRVDRRLEKLFDDAFKPRYGIPTAGSMYRILEATGALEERRGAHLQRATRSLWSPFGQFMDAALNQSRRELGNLREGLAAEIRLLGARAARLEALDAILAEATAARVLALTLRLRGAAEERFADALKAAVRALPPAPTQPALYEAWYQPGGWIPTFIDELRHAVLAVHDHQRNLIEALVDASLAEP